MSENNSSYLRTEIQSDAVFVLVNAIDEIEICNNVKFLPDMKKNVVGLTVIKNNVLPVISFSEKNSPPFRGIVLNLDQAKFFLKVDAVSSISELKIVDAESTKNDFIFKSGNKKIINLKAIERHLL